MKIFVKASQFDLTLEKGRSPEPKLRKVKFVTRSSNFLGLEINNRTWVQAHVKNTQIITQFEPATSGDSVSDHILHGYG